MTKTLAIVGAGPKAVALAARAAVLRALADDPTTVPDLVILERDEVGAAWSGSARFSSGFLELCTPPEKDVGYPYDEDLLRPGYSAPIAPALFGRFSWAAFCVAKRRYADWVDRGRHHPVHREWTAYLRWVMEQAGQKVRRAAVTAVRPRGARWEVEFTEEGNSKTIRVDGVVITGTGAARRVPALADVPPERLLDAESFWPDRDKLVLPPDSTIAVVGDGGGAGAIIGWLADRYAEAGIGIVSINPMGTLFPRGDGYAERRWFSDPSEWRELSVKHREKLIERTEAGVISSRNKDRIDRCAFLTFARGYADEARWAGGELLIAVSYDGQPAAPVQANYLVSAIGFESWSLLDIVDDPARAALLAPAGEGARKQAREEMDWDLALPSVSGLPPGFMYPRLPTLRRGLVSAISGA